MTNQKGLIYYFLFVTLMMEIFDTTVYILPCSFYICIYGLSFENKGFFLVLLLLLLLLLLLWNTHSHIYTVLTPANSNQYFDGDPHRIFKIIYLQHTSRNFFIIALLCACFTFRLNAVSICFKSTLIWSICLFYIMYAIENAVTIYTALIQLVINVNANLCLPNC